MADFRSKSANGRLVHLLRHPVVGDAQFIAMTHVLVICDTVQYVCNCVMTSSK